MTAGTPPTPLQASRAFRTTQDAFQEIYGVFLVLGTLVGVVVISYMVYNAYKYRDGNGDLDRDLATPEPGELPKGEGGGKKLLLSFSLSAIIVISLVGWTYFTLLYIEDGPDVQPEERMEIDVTAFQWGFEFEYPNGHTTTGELRVPRGQVVWMEVTSADVFHNIGIPDFRRKTDAIPGQTTTMWFTANETGTYQAACYELCGSGHSFMTADVVVMPQDEFREWYRGTGGGNATESETQTTGNSHE